MPTTSLDVLDRMPSRRFVRNLALSLSVGALLTLIGAGVAQADEAATASDGTGAAGTGDATAVGNRSGTQATQGTGASTSGSNIQIINQNAGVANAGVAVANTGGNVAIGNGSNNLATVAQVAQGGPLGLAVNNGNASNASDGGALISTGDAYAIGNDSTTTIDQRADGQAHGTLGGVLVLSQNALVVNAGLGIANSGLNIAVGNASGRNPLNGFAPNTAGVLQDAFNSGTGPGGATNSGSASNASNGHATISTGSASAAGNRSSTNVSQIAGSTDGDGPDPSGLSVITQLGGALNAGAAVANSGVNGAVGNVSGSNAEVTGDPAAGDPNVPGQGAAAEFAGVGFANNSASATNASDGTAWITTGAATAIGNDSRTAIVQDAHAEFGDQGVNIQTQLAPVVNVGLGVANSGVNGAVGNASVSAGQLNQDAFGDDNGVSLLGIVNNSGEMANSSNGSAEIHTGDARGQGNWSDTTVSQWAEATGDALAVQTQAELVANVGVGVANSGVNGAVGNVSQNAVSGFQTAALVPGSGLLGQVTVHNAGSWSNDSEGRAAVTTGDADASGNESTTRVGQAIDPTGTHIQTQAAVVVNAGLGVSNSGVNAAVGNVSDNFTLFNGAFMIQNNQVTPDNLVAGIATVSNQGEASNASDGSASIATGDASSVGNRSTTGVAQDATASSEALGLVVNTQLGAVVNAGAGIANSGGNVAVGNASDNRSDLFQTAELDGGQVLAGVLTSSNAGAATNATNGRAVVTTGATSATGNVSATDVSQTAAGSNAGLGVGVNTQLGVVANLGAGIANSGGNVAVGNVSRSEAYLDQFASIFPNPASAGVLVAPVVTNFNAGEASNASDGTAEIHTGAAMAVGNTSDTRLRQHAVATVDGIGAVVNTQVGVVGNVGVGLANSGVNLAIGNASNNELDDPGVPGFPGVVQLASIGSPAGGPQLIAALGPVTNGNSGSATNTSDGLGSIRTGDTQAQGNVSATAMGQDATGTIGEDGFGVVPNLQVAGTLNLGAGVANSGVNLSVGNASGALPPLVPPPFLITNANRAGLGQESNVAAGGSDVVVAGPLTNVNSGEAGNTSNGSGKVVTGHALATGNVSSTNLNQNVRGNVDGLGLVVGPQLGLVVNAGAGIANSGINAALGNVSNSTVLARQSSTFDPVLDTTVIGPLTVGNNGSATNASDGEACVCTGNAVATGNVSTSTLSQDLNIGVDDGLSVVPMNGLILNAGFGLANSGVNAAIGNISQNLATSDQTVTLDPGAGALLIGPQTFVNGGGADNTSDGTGKVGTGNARADGNISSSDLIQGVSVDGAGTFALVNGAIGNVGAGLANAGVNAGIGNGSANQASLVQAATGTGTVANQGRASNASDGFGGVGDPNCDVPVDEVPAPEAPGTPGLPSLPKTGGPLEVEAAIGAMLIAAGFAFRRAGTAVRRRR